MGEETHGWTHWGQAILSSGRENPAEPKVKGGLEKNFSATMATHSAHWGAADGLEAHFPKPFLAPSNPSK